MPALEIIVGKSVRQLRRILNPPALPKTRSYDLVLELKRLLDLSGRISAQLGPVPEVPELAALKAELGRTDRQASRALAVLGA